MQELKKIKNSNPFICWSMILFLSMLFLFAANEFCRRVIGGFAGSYPYAEAWNIAAKEEDVIKAIQQIKNENPILKPQKDSSFRSGYWFYEDFYFADTKQTVHAWTRPGQNEFTTDIAFISITDNNNADKLINKDFWYWDNRKEINKFRKEIVEKIENIVYFKK